MKNGDITRFALSAKDVSIIADLNQEAVKLAAKIQKNFEELGV